MKPTEDSHSPAKPADRYTVRGGVVNAVESGSGADSPAKRPSGPDTKDPVLDPADAPKRPPPGTGGGDGAPMG